jgi:hypothetical protein
MLLSPETRGHMLKTGNIKNGGTTAAIVFLLGSVGLVAVMALDKIYWRTGLIAEGWPNSYPGHIIRSIVIFLSLLAMCWSLIGSSKPKLILTVRNGLPLEQLSIVGALSVSVVILSLFILAPFAFSELSLEDGPIEWGSAILLFASSIISAVSALKSRKVSNISKATRLSLSLLSLAFFVMAMEEISWFQRVLKTETPKVFSGNIQGEMNLHNFATNQLENAYYFGAFLFLVVLPFVTLLIPYMSNNSYLKIVSPRPFIGVIGSIACAYNFDMWNIIFTQIAFFGSIVILFAFATFSKIRRERYVILFTMVLVATTQALFLVNGANFARIWEVTEYKELLIPLAFYLYSLDVFNYWSLAVT